MKRVRIMIDPDPGSPREWDNLGHMVCWHRRYNLGDEQPKNAPGVWLKDFSRRYPKAVILPIYLYDHSGIVVSTKPFSCPWDSGQVGWIFVTGKMAKKEGFNLAKDRARIEECLRGEVETYSDYLSGNVYGYIVEESDDGENWRHEDSCWGFFGDPKESGIMEYIPKKLHDSVVYE